MFLGSHHVGFYDHQKYLAYQVVGAFWYLLSVESELRCWRRQLKNVDLGCRNRTQDIITLLNQTCSFIDPDDLKDRKNYNFGIFFDALHSGVVESTTEFSEKFFYCFWWGLRSLRLVKIFLFLLFIYMQVLRTCSMKCITFIYMQMLRTVA